MIAQQNKYLETVIQTATPGQLLIMLCDGAIRNCKKAIEAIREQRLEEANTQLCRAQAIIREFTVTLDRKATIADGLLKLYDYFIFRLIEANTKKAIEPAEEVLGYLIELKETWVEAAKLVNVASAGVKQHG